MTEVFSLGSLVFIIVGMFLFTSISHYSKKFHVFPEIIWILIFGIVYGVFQKYVPVFNLPQFKIDSSVILHIFVPILIFAASQKICLFDFRKVLVPTSILASIGVVISMFFIAFLLNSVFQIPLLPAILFGVIMSATDPLAVGALISKNKKIKESTKLIIEGESILNDGFVVTVFGILTLILFEGHKFKPLISSYEFLYHIVVALVIGIVFGRGIRYMLESWHEEHFTLSINMTILLAFSSFAVAEAFHASGIIAVFVAALAYGDKPYQKKHNRHIHKDIWEYIEYLTNSILFFFLGAAFISQSDTTFLHTGFVLASLAILIFSRAISLGFLLPFLRIDTKKFSFFDFSLLHLAGSRGAVSISLVLLIPDSFEYKGFFLSLAFLIIIFGLMINPLILQKLTKK